MDNMMFGVTFGVLQLFHHKKHDWVQTSSSTLQMDLVQFLSSKAQNFLLASAFGQTKHKKSFEEEKYSCVTMNCTEEETLIHLFWSCPFAKECWDFICPGRTRNLSIWEAITDLKEKIGKPFAMDIIILAAWSIWLVRNNNVLKNERPSFASWKAIYFQELRLVAHRMKKKHADSFKEWLQSHT